MNEQLAKELIKIRNIVKQKYRSLRTDKSKTQRRLEEEYKPITQPLQKFLSNIKSDVKLEPPDKGVKDEKFSFAKFTASSPRPSVIATNPLQPLLPPGGITFLEDTYISERQDPFESAVQSSDNDETINEVVEQSRQFLADLSNQPGYQHWLEEFDPLPRSYIDEQIRGTPSDYDHVYGIRHDIPTGKFSIGNALVDFIGKDIQIFRKHELLPDMKRLYEGTLGMYELLFKQQPVGYTNTDLDNYMDLLDKVSAYRRNNDPTEQVQGSSNSKYITIVRPWLVKKNILKNQVLRSLVEPSILRERSMSVTSQLPRATRLRSKKGGAMMDLSNKTLDYIYYDDPNEIVKRLQLLIASQMAGHTGHHNEIMSIIEELREAKIIE